MKISIQDLNKEVSVTIDDSSDITQLGEALKGLLVNYGYHPQNIDDLFTLEKWGYFEGDEK